MRIPVQLQRAGSLTAAMSLVVGLLAVVPATLAAGATQSITTLGAWSVSPVPVGMTSDITATVTSGATGDVVFSLDSAPVATVPVDLAGHASWTLPADASAGLHEVKAQYQGDATYATSEDAASITVGPRATLTTVSLGGTPTANGASAQRGDVVTITVDVVDLGATGTVPVSGGHITVSVDGVAKASFDLPQTSVGLNTSTLGLGDRQVIAAFDPGAATDHVGSSSPTRTLTLLANTVDATASIQYTTFYPYRDGYRDTDALRGKRLETATVKIVIKSPTGTTVRQKTIASGTGVWSYAWDGRNSSGAILAAGRYTVRQTVTDAHGMSKTFTSYVSISTKRLYTYTVALRKNASTQVAKVAADHTWFGWSFSLPSATVYKRLVFAVYGRSGLPAGDFGPHSYALCPSISTWSWLSCMRPWTTFPTTLSWKSVTGSTTNNRHGTNVRMYAVGGYHTAVAYARVTVTYAVLR